MMKHVRSNYRSNNQSAMGFYESLYFPLLKPRKISRSLKSLFYIDYWLREIIQRNGEISSMLRFVGTSKHTASLLNSHEALYFCTVGSDLDCHIGYSCRRRSGLDSGHPSLSCSTVLSSLISLVDYTPNGSWEIEKLLYIIQGWG